MKLSLLGVPTTIGLTLCWLSASAAEPAPPVATLSLQGMTHPDSLSVDIRVFGQSILRDPGSLGHGHPMHAQFAAKTRAHSVLVVDGQEMDTRFPEALGGGETDELQWAAGAQDWPGEIRPPLRKR